MWAPSQAQGHRGGLQSWLGLARVLQPLQALQLELLLGWNSELSIEGRICSVLLLIRDP